MMERRYCTECGVRIYYADEEIFPQLNDLLCGKEVTYVNRWCGGTYEKTYQLQQKYNYFYMLGDLLRLPGDLDEQTKVAEQIGHQCTIIEDWNYPRTEKVHYAVMTDTFRASKSYKKSYDIVYENKNTNTCKCPICSGKTIEYPDARWRYLVKDFLEEQENRKKKESSACCSNFITECKDKFVAENIESKSGSVEVKKYLQHLFNIEKDILSLQEYLKKLFYMDMDPSNMLKRYNLISQIDAKSLVESEISGLIEEKNGLSVKYPLPKLEISDSETGIEFPQKPELKKPGFFNKKKIEAENQVLLKEYEDKYALSKQECEQKRKEMVAERMQQKAEIEECIHKETLRLDGLLQELEEKKNVISVDNTQCTQYATHSFYLEQIEVVKSKIIELFEARKQYHEMGIVYPKYLDFVAVTTMLEYFETGRCSELEGPNGAYNLYESEIRANRIISQLDQVISSLEDIKDNQYKAYSALLSINKDISNISDKVTSIGITLTEMNRTVSDIKNNTEYIAYTSAQTAYYSKINAELTNALGYLIALK